MRASTTWKPIRVAEGSANLPRILCGSELAVMLDDRWWMEAVRDTPSHMYYSTEIAGGLYADKAPSNVASISEVGKYLNITIPYDALHASFPRFHHQSRQVQQMAAPPTDERCIQHASGVDRDDAQEAGPLELL